MVKCLSFCLIGAALLGSMIMTMLVSKKSKPFVTFMSLLDDNQQQIYKSIIRERTNIYVQGLVIGVALALLITYHTGFKRVANVCLFIAISLGFNWAYYLLYPKTTYMLNHLSSSAQVKAWLNIYKEMKFRSHTGLLLGAFGYVLIAAGWCK